MKNKATGDKMGQSEETMSMEELASGFVEVGKDASDEEKYNFMMQIPGFAENMNNFNALVDAGYDAVKEQLPERVAGMTISLNDGIKERCPECGDIDADSVAEETMAEIEERLPEIVDSLKDGANSTLQYQTAAMVFDKYYDAFEKRGHLLEGVKQIQDNARQRYEEKPYSDAAVKGMANNLGGLISSGRMDSVRRVLPAIMGMPEGYVKAVEEEINNSRAENGLQPVSLEALAQQPDAPDTAPVAGMGGGAAP